MKALTVHYTPSCAFSIATLGFLALRGADFRMVNLDEHPDERARLQRQLGGRKLETPTLELDGELHVAPSLSELARQLAGWGLSSAAAPHQQLKNRAD